MHRNSFWKHNKSEKHINILRLEQIDNYDEIIEILECLFREKRDRNFVNPFHSKLLSSDQYNVLSNHNNPIGLNSELEVVGKFIQYIAQVHIHNIVKQMAIKYGELIGQFNFKIKVHANVRYEI